MNKKSIEGKFTYKKIDKLKSRKLIDQLFSKGKSFSIFPFRILYINSCNPGGILQAGFGVSSKKFKKAVDRNAIKRLMREAYRLNKNNLGEQLKISNKNLDVFVLYTGNERPDYKLVFHKMGLVLDRLFNLVNEDFVTNT